MAQSDRLYFRADDTLKDGVERFQAREGFDNLSDATRKLVEVGLREQQNPIVYRLKDHAVESINLLSMSAVVVFALGAATNLFAFGEGIVGSLVLLFLACGYLAVVEFVRIVAAANEMGVRVRAGLTTMAAVVSRR